MNRTTATCIAGMRSKTTSRIRVLFPRPKNRVDEVFYAVSVGLGIFAKRLRWRPERNPL